MNFGAWIALGVAVFALLVILVAMPFYFFSYAILRKEPMDLSDPEQTKGTQYEAFSGEIAKAISWVKQQKIEQMSVTSYDGLILKGKWISNPDQKGILLMFHGYHSEAVQDFACALPFYYSLGYSMLLVDQRAHGDSEGKYITFGAKERYDVMTWCEALVKRFGRHEPIFLDGISMGATTVLLASELKLAGNVRGIIADCGFTSPIEEFRHVLRTQFRLPAFPLIPLVQIIAKHRAEFVFDSVNTLDSLTRCRYPVLFIHGKEDHFVPTYMTEENYAACKSKKTMHLIDGAAHGGSYLTDKERCEKALKEFLFTHNKNHK